MSQYLAVIELSKLTGITGADPSFRLDGSNAKTPLIVPLGIFVSGSGSDTICLQRPHYCLLSHQLDCRRQELTDCIPR